MQGTFNADEIFQMAVEIERQGTAFYRYASECFDDPGVKSMLKGLSEMEKDHEREFASLRERVTANDPYSHGYDPDGAAAAYLGSMKSGEVFGSALSFTGNESLEEVLKKGIEAEKNSIVLYTGLRDIIPEELGRDKVDRIIREEMKHVTVLARILGSIGR